MIRRIIKIEEEKCNGCGLCVKACHEGAIELIDGKAKLTREDYCDGLGDCLPECPGGAITFEEREAPAYDKEAVLAAQRKTAEKAGVKNQESVSEGPAVSRLAQWPCQLKLVPVDAPYFKGAELLIAADCTAYAYAGIHEDYMKDRVTLIGCPKLDSVDYSEKLLKILKGSDISGVTVLRMEVPCCGGLEMAVKKALQNCGRFIPCRVVTISTEGSVRSSDNFLLSSYIR
ncbi:MAG: 4Fe-4S binding protein [Lachnospiraceae bacterium]|nr:4Fe-4S binding protein [Lachnospiraceae bacterium]